MVEYPVIQERTGYRDLSFLRRHRDWGWNCPAEDIDFLEYDNKKAVALVEYKMRSNLEICTAPKATDRGFANLAALIDLGNRANIPVFLVFYKHKWYFRIINLNRSAIESQPPVGIISEFTYVKFLYVLRGRVLPEEIGAKLIR